MNDSSLYSLTYLLSEALGSFAVCKFLKSFFNTSNVKKIVEVIACIGYYILNVIIYMAFNIPAINFVANIIAFFLITCIYSSSIRKKVLVTLKQIDETEFELAFIALFNNLKLHCAEIISPMYRQLQRLADLGESANTQVAEIRREIAEQKEQSYLLAQLNSQGVIEPVYFSARSRELDRNLVRLQNRLHSMLDGEDDERLENLRKLIAVLEKDELLTEFDEDKFGSIVEKITVLSDCEMRFELISGVGFNEKIRRKRR